MNVYNISTILLIFTLILTANQLSFKLTNAPVCLKFSGGDRYNFQYISSGEDPEKMAVDIFENSQLKLTKQGVSDFHGVLTFIPGEIKLCFKNLNSKEKVISFDFYKEDDPFKTVIDKKDFRTVLSSLSKTIESMREVGRNQQFHIERDEVNKNILQKSENKIKWTGIIKIVFLLASALIQLWIMKGFFKQNSVPYQPIDQ